MSSRPPVLVLAAGLVSSACATELPACDRMCVAATAVYGACLDDWELDWDAAGYRGSGDFEQSCQTWVWEMQELEKDAVDEGILNERGALVQTCRERHADLSADDASCETYTALDWSRAPWESPADPDAATARRPAGSP